MDRKALRGAVVRCQKLKTSALVCSKDAGKLLANSVDKRLTLIWKHMARFVCLLPDRWPGLSAEQAAPVYWLLRTWRTSSPSSLTMRT